MKKSTILIVDDVAENLIVMGEILSQYNIKIAKDGEKALSIVKESRDISLIILDIMMPGIDGFETCRRLKKDPSTFDIPVIFMTSLSDTEDIVKGFELGAVDYVTKPIKGKELLARVNTHLTLSLLQREMKLINKLLEAKVVERTAELQAAKEKAEESSKLKSHFLSLMSHEFRTPLNGILGYAELLMLELTNEEWKEFAEGIYNSGRRLTETLNSILNLARFESDQKEIIPASFNVIDRLNQLLQSYHLMAKQKDVTLKVNSNIAEIDFKTDKTIFDICINSLLSNAVKYTKKSGKIEVKVEKNDQDNELNIYVVDNGIGIPNDKLDIIFEEFRQVDEGQGRNFEGVGLGLTIAKKYIEKLGGNISVTSTLGIGSTFKLSFPSSDEKIKETVSALSQEINAESNPKILVVEDDEINVRVVKLFLRRTTKFVDVANSGEEALSLVKQNKYDVILMDINLGSGIDGVQTTTEIRKIDGYKSTPIIAVTAYAYDDDKNSFLSKGFSNYLAKPYNGKDLLNMIKNELVAHNK